MLNWISTKSNTPYDWDKFIESIITRGKNPYPDGLQLDPEASYCLKFLEVIMTYYDLEFTEDEIERLQNDSNFDILFDSIMTSYVGAEVEYTEEELSLIISYMAAERRYMDVIGLDGIVDYIEEFPDDDVGLILQYYLQTNANYHIERIIDTLDKHGWDYNRIYKIKSYLGKKSRSEYQSDRISREKLMVLFRYFNGIKLKIREDERIEQVVAEAEERMKLEIKFINDQQQDIAIEATNVEEEIKEQMIPLQDPEPRGRFTLDLQAWSTKDNRGVNDGVKILSKYSPDFINISNINTTFNTNFILSRERLHGILVNKYRMTNCSFEPNYGGINLSFLSRIDCEQHDDNTDENIITPEYKGCHCKQVSILIFPNITLITGGRSFRQIIDAYYFIKKVLIDEFEKILKIDQNCPDPMDKYPNMISSNRYVYLKKKFILDNPKNHFIIKKLGLLGNYDWTVENNSDEECYI